LDVKALRNFKDGMSFCYGIPSEMHTCQETYALNDSMTGAMRESSVTCLSYLMFVSILLITRMKDTSFSIFLNAHQNVVAHEECAPIVAILTLEEKTKVKNNLTLCPVEHAII